MSQGNVSQSVIICIKTTESCAPSRSSQCKLMGRNLEYGFLNKCATSLLSKSNACKQCQSFQEQGQSANWRTCLCCHLLSISLKFSTGKHRKKYLFFKQWFSWCIIPHQNLNSHSAKWPTSYCFINIPKTKYWMGILKSIFVWQDLWSSCQLKYLCEGAQVALSKSITIKKC